MHRFVLYCTIIILPKWLCRIVRFQLKTYSTLKHQRLQSHCKLLCQKFSTKRTILVIVLEFQFKVLKKVIVLLFLVAPLYTRHHKMNDKLLKKNAAELSEPFSFKKDEKRKTDIVNYCSYVLCAYNISYPVSGTVAVVVSVMLLFHTTVTL